MADEKRVGRCFAFGALIGYNINAVISSLLILMEKSPYDTLHYARDTENTINQLESVTNMLLQAFKDGCIDGETFEKMDSLISELKGLLSGVFGVTVEAAQGLREAVDELMSFDEKFAEVLLPLIE